MKRMAGNENFKASCRTLFPTEFDHFSVILEKVKELSVHRTIMQSRRVDLIALREHIEEREEIIAMYRSAMEEQQREKLRAKRLLGTPSPIPSPTTPDRMRTYSAALSLTSKHP